MYPDNIKTKENLVKRLAYYLSEINAIHPFREGNGRSQRMFIYLLCDSLNYHLDILKIANEEMLEASARSFDRDCALLEELLRRSLTSQITKSSS